MHMKKHTAFSLVELAIVLVILGLLVGGILAGRSLIRASELRSVTADITRYRTVLYAFKDKYFAWPGDMMNATSFWGALDPDQTTCEGISSTGLPTCNGDGNGQLSATTSPEGYRAWQHLANAGLIEGIYSGRATGGPGSFTSTPSNVPRSRFANTGYSIRYQSTTPVGGSGERFAGKSGNLLHVGRMNTGYNAGGVFPPEDQYNIDMKMDDGKPGLGTVQSYKGSGALNTGCTTSDIEATADYAFNEGGPVCHVVYWLGF